MKRRPEYSSRFKKEVRLAESRGKDLGKLWRLAGMLLDGLELPLTYLDHPLKGNWVGYRDAHIESDWVLIYKIAGDTVRFERTGRHSDLFSE